MRTLLYIITVMALPSMAYAFDYSQLLSMEFYAPFLPVLILVVEFVLGKTDWVKSNSIIDLLLKGLLKLVKKDEKL